MEVLTLQMEAEMPKKITFTLGITPGYGHHNEGAADEAATLRAAVEAAKKAAACVWETTGGENGGVYPSFVASPTRVGYRTEWGCPDGGEFAVIFSGNQNPEFCPDGQKFFEAWMKFAELLKKEFRQKTATFEVVEVEFHYLK
jgi:hypothetical protein